MLALLLLLLILFWVNIIEAGLTSSSLGLGAGTCIPVTNMIRGEWHFLPRFTHSFTLQIFMRHLLCAGWKKTNNEWADSKDGSLCIKDWMPCLGHGRGHMPPCRGTLSSLLQSCRFSLSSVIMRKASRLERSTQPTLGSYVWRIGSCRDTRSTAHSMREKGTSALSQWECRIDSRQHKPILSWLTRWLSFPLLSPFGN